MNDLGLISIISLISPWTSQRVLSKALIIMVLGLIRDISTFRCLRVAIGQTIRANPLLINTLAMIMSSHFTTICMDKVWSLPFGGNSSFENETKLVANINDTIPLKKEHEFPSTTSIELHDGPLKIATGLKYKSELEICSTVESHYNRPFRWFSRIPRLLLWWPHSWLAWLCSYQSLSSFFLVP